MATKRIFPVALGASGLGLAAAHKLCDTASLDGPTVLWRRREPSGHEDRRSPSADGIASSAEASDTVAPSTLVLAPKLDVHEQQLADSWVDTGAASHSMFREQKQQLQQQSLDSSRQLVRQALLGPQGAGPDAMWDSSVFRKMGDHLSQQEKAVVERVVHKAVDVGVHMTTKPQFQQLADEAAAEMEAKMADLPDNFLEDASPDDLLGSFTGGLSLSSDCSWNPEVERPQQEDIEAGSHEGDVEAAGTVVAARARMEQAVHTQLQQIAADLQTFTTDSLQQLRDNLRKLRSPHQKDTLAGALGMGATPSKAESWKEFAIKLAKRVGLAVLVLAVGTMAAEYFGLVSLARVGVAAVASTM